MRPNQVEHYCRCDASLCGWGSIELSTNKHANGRWSAKEAKLSINILELLAICYSLQSFYNKLVNTHIQIESDNVSAIKYMNDMGGMTCNVMDSIAKEIWEWCVKRNLFVSAVHVPGIENTADFFSRNFSDSTEWMLKTDIFNRVCLQFFKPDIDLFASRLNRQLDMFVSWFPEPGAYHVNAFSFSWSGICPYIFPPFGLLGKVINKVKKEGVEKAIVIFPLWRSQSWFPMLIEVLSDFPVRLPRHRDLLTLPHNGMEHPLARKTTMVAAVISGNHLKVKAFYEKLPMLSSNPGDLEHSNSMNWHGRNDIFGVYSGKLVHLLPLKLK